MLIADCKCGLPQLTTDSIRNPKPETRNLKPETLNLLCRRRGVSPDQAAHNTLDLDAFRRLDKDWFELRVGRLEANEIWFARIILECSTDLVDEHLHVVGVHMGPAPDG